MTKRKKNTPKADELGYNPLVNHDFETILIGIMIVLFGVLGLTNSTFVSGLLNYTVTVFVGSYNFIGFLFIIFLGFHRVIAKRPFRIKANWLTIGVIILTVSLLGLATYITLAATPGEPVTIINFFNLFKNSFPLLKDIPTSYDAAVAGGIVGYLFLGICNSIAGTQNGLVLIIIALAIGLAMALKTLWQWLYRVIKHRAGLAKQERERLEAAKKLGSQTPDESAKPETAYVAPKPSGWASRSLTYTRSLQDTSGAATLQKAQYVPKFASSRPVTPEPKPQPNPRTETPEPAFVPAIEPQRPDNKYVGPTFDQNPMQPLREPDIPGLGHQKAMPAAGPSYVLPDIDLLSDIPEDVDFEYNDDVSLRRMDIINQTFRDFNVKAETVSYQVGPAVTSFDIILDRTTFVKSVAAVINEISIRLGGMPSIFNEVVYGKTNPTLEVPNEKIAIVSYKEMLKAINADSKFNGKIVIPFGKNLQGGIEAAPLREIVHMLVAGTTGSGKSVFMHTLIMTMLMRDTPEDIRLLMIDPKRVEMNRYRDIPHLLCPVINDYGEAKVALTRLVAEMKRRFALFHDLDISNIENYNRYARDTDSETLPVIAAIIDEYADLAEGINGITELVELLAAQARAAGIHLIIATQRPIIKVISGNIKNNITTKVAMRMNSQVDSVTVLGHAGAEKLLDKGDMIAASSKLSRHGELRLQGAYVPEEDTMCVANDIKQRYQPHYHPDFLNLVDITAMGPSFGGEFELKADERYEEIKNYVLTQEYISANRLTRAYGFGYSRAANIIGLLQRDNIIAKAPDTPQSNKGLRVIANIDDNEQL